MTVDQALGLGLACALLVAVPGPSVLFLVGRALTYGRATALASMAGNCLGSYLAAVCVALGIGPLLESSSLLLHALRLLGAAYLVWLGVQAVRHAGTSAGLAAAGGAPAPPQGNRRAAVRAGVLVGVSNPKTFLIFAAVLPPFVDRGPDASSPVVVQMLVLGLVPVVIGLLTDTAWVLAASRARAWLAGSARRARAVGRAGGAALLGLGASVALGGRGEH